MKYLFCLFSILYLIPSSATEEASFPSAKLFSLSSKEMVFASKLSDVNRRRFCYSFSIKERSLAMQADDALSPDQKVEEVYSSFYAKLEPKTHTR